jgi:hypothetical protein
VGGVVSPPCRAGHTTDAAASSRRLAPPSANARRGRSQRCAPTRTRWPHIADTRPQRMASLSGRRRKALEGRLAWTSRAECRTGQWARALPLCRGSDCLAGSAGCAAERHHRAPGAADSDAHLILWPDDCMRTSRDTTGRPASARQRAAPSAHVAEASFESRPLSGLPDAFPGALPSTAWSSSRSSNFPPTI